MEVQESQEQSEDEVELLTQPSAKYQRPQRKRRRAETEVWKEKAQRLEVQLAESSSQLANVRTQHHLWHSSAEEMMNHQARSVNELAAENIRLKTQMMDGQMKAVHKVNFV